MFVRALLLMALFVSPAVHADLEEKWFACDRDSDCLKLPDLCATWTGVNKKYKGEFAKYVHASVPLTSCMRISQAETEQRKAEVPKCLKRKCALIPPRK